MVKGGVDSAEYIATSPTRVYRDSRRNIRGGDYGIDADTANTEYLLKMMRDDEEQRRRYKTDNTADKKRPNATVVEKPVDDENTVEPEPIKGQEPPEKKPPKPPKTTPADSNKAKAYELEEQRRRANALKNKSGIYNDIDIDTELEPNETGDQE